MKSSFVNSYFFFLDRSFSLFSFQNDLISWLMEEAESPQLTVKLLVTRVLLVNFATIHVSEQLFGRID